MVVLGFGLKLSCFDQRGKFDMGVWSKCSNLPRTYMPSFMFLFFSGLMPSVYYNTFLHLPGVDYSQPHKYPLKLLALSLVGGFGNIILGRRHCTQEGAQTYRGAGYSPESVCVGLCGKGTAQPVT